MDFQRPGDKKRICIRIHRMESEMKEDLIFYLKQYFMTSIIDNFA